MRTTTTLLRIGLLLTLVVMQARAFAQTYDIYLCNSGTATITPAGYTAGDNILYYEGATLLATKASTTPTYTPTITTDGLHTYTVQIQSAAGCLSDPTTVTIDKLPNLVVDMAATSGYCTNGGSTAANITASINSSVGTLPSGVTVTYTWAVSTNSGTSYAAPSGIGTLNTATDVFTMTTTTVGTYLYKATGKYVMTNGKTLKTGAVGVDCTYIATSPASVIVSPKPSAPTITVN